MAEEKSKQESSGSGLKKPEVKKSEALWLMTFSDLSFILMCFFVLMIAVSKPNQQKFDNVKAGMSSKPTKDSLHSMSQKIEREIKRQKIDKVANVKLDTEGLAIEFKDKLLFSSGSAKPNPRFQRYVSKVMKLIAKSPSKYKITIEGHTDDLPVGSRSPFQSNWELSAARGISLLNQFKTQGVSRERMRVVAYADTKPKVNIAELPPHQLSQARSANRRVVIRLE